MMQALDSAQLYFSRAASALELSDRVTAMLAGAYREVRVQLPIEMDDDTSPPSAVIAFNTITLGGR